MKKKRYYGQPAMHVVELQVRNQLLAGSTGQGGFGGDPEEENMD